MRNLSLNISKTLSSILRHNAGGREMDIDGEGFASFDDVVRLVGEQPKFLGDTITAEMVEEVVREDEKGRFEIDGDSIRARSGHSFAVDTGGTAFLPDGPLYFGTVTASRDEILGNGMVASRKIKVRLVRTPEEAIGIAAARRGDPFIVEVDAVTLSNDGASFRLLSNGEVLTGKFGPKYVSEFVPGPVSISEQSY